MIQSPPVYINREVVVEKEVIIDHYITNIEEIMVKKFLIFNKIQIDASSSR